MKTAVIVRGNARTWNYVKHNNIKLFNDLYDYPDWYIAFPDTGTVTKESLIEDFQGSNLKSIQLVSDADYPFFQDDVYKYYSNWNYYSPAYWRQAWLDYIAGLAKRKYELENNIRYTNVLGFRPDNWFEVPTSERLLVCQELDPMCISNTTFSGDIGINDWLTADFIWRAGSTASDLYCMRFIDTYFTGAIQNQFIHFGEHTMPGYYQARNFIDGRTNVGHFREYIITPNAPLPWNTDLYNDNYYKVVWHTLTVEQRQQMCLNLNINPKDYQVG